MNTTETQNTFDDILELLPVEVETEINEVDISKIKLGQQVEIRLDAFSDTIFSGKTISTNPFPL